MKVDCPACRLQFEWPGEEWPESGVRCAGCEQVFWKPAAQTLKYSASSGPALSPPGGELRPQTLREDEVLPDGALLGQYRVEDFVGRGGMGTVYRARHTMLDRTVALKVLPAGLSRDPEFVRRFKREALALAGLNHPHIVAVHDMGVQGELHFLVMEFVDGVNLRDVLVHKKLTPEQALRIVPQLCDALEYAHSKGVIHRDIKPENILLDREGTAKIADFGLAKIVKGETSVVPLTQTNVIMGTVDYMAPEQRDSLKTVDHRADIFSMGVVLYELLTGELPMGRFDLPSHRVQVDVRIDDVVLRALEKDPDRRYQRAGHMGTAVTQVMTTPPPARDCPVKELKTGKAIGTAPGRRLAVRASECDVAINGWGREEIGLEVSGPYLFSPTAGAALLQSEAGTKSMTVYVPRGAEVDIVSSSGDVRAASTAGALKFGLSEGDLEVRGHEGPLSVSGGNGDVTVDGLRSENAEIHLGNGDVTVSGLDLARGRADFQSGNGDVEVSATSGSSFRYRLESGGGDVTGPDGKEGNPVEGQVGAGAANLSAASGNGDVSLAVGGAARPSLPAFRDIVRGLTPKQVEKIGVYVIVNIALFFFFLFVAGTIIPFVCMAAFWGMAIALDIWRGHMQRVRGVAPPRAAPAPAPPPDAAPPRPRMSLLAVLALLGGLAAGLVAAGGGVAVFLEQGDFMADVGDKDAGELRIVQFVMGAAGLVLAVLSFAAAMAALSCAREARGALRGRGAGASAMLLSLVALGFVVLYVGPHLGKVSRAGSSARRQAAVFALQLREGRVSDASELLTAEARKNFPVEKLAPALQASRESVPGRWRDLFFDEVRVSLDRSHCRVQFYLRRGGGVNGWMAMVNEGGRWRVSDPERFLAGMEVRVDGTFQR